MYARKCYMTCNVGVYIAQYVHVYCYVYMYIYIYKLCVCVELICVQKGLSFMDESLGVIVLASVRIANGGLSVSVIGSTAHVYV